MRKIERLANRYLQRVHLGGAVLVSMEKAGALHSHTIDPDGNLTRISTSDARGAIERSFWSLLPSLTPEPANLVEDESTASASEDHLKIAPAGTVFWIDRETGGCATKCYGPSDSSDPWLLH